MGFGTHGGLWSQSPVDTEGRLYRVGRLTCLKEVSRSAVGVKLCTVSEGS